MGNLSLLKTNPDASKAADIKKYFGLQWIDGTPGTVGPPLSPATPGHWQYVAKTGTSLQSSIGAFTTDP
mgnify:CR=1 FL=1